MTPPMPSISSRPVDARRWRRARTHQCVEIDARASRAARPCRATAARRSARARCARSRLSVDRLAERGEQHARIARRGGGRIEAGDDRLERVDRAGRRARPVPDQAGGDEGLADVGAGRGDEDRAHALRQDARAHDARRGGRSRASGCAALKVSRSRAVPSGTVGGRIATTRKPSCFEQLREASSAAAASPITTGTIALSRLRQIRRRG